jgi:hypothetical protein
VAWVVGVEARLHDDAPDVHANVKDYNNIQPELRAAPLGQGFHVKDEAKAKATDTIQENWLGVVLRRGIR